MPLIDVIQKDLLKAMKSKDQLRLGTIRLMKAALKKQEVDGGEALDETGEMKILKTLVKQRQDAIEMYRKGGREELAEKEAAEMAIIQTYLPAGASQEEMDAAVAAAIAETGASSMPQMGLVMKAARERLAGKTVDGKALSEKVRALLG
jgi:hypothetical protein